MSVCSFLENLSVTHSFLSFMHLCFSFQSFQTVCLCKSGSSDKLELLVTLLAINILPLPVFAFKDCFILDSSWMKFIVSSEADPFSECLLSQKRMISFMYKSGHKYACISSHLLCMIMNISMTLFCDLYFWGDVFSFSLVAIHTLFS